MMRPTRRMFLALSFACAVTALGVASKTVQGADAAPAAESNASAPDSDCVKGSLVIIGGALRTTDTSVMSQILELAGGRGASIAIFPTASGSPMHSGEKVAAILKRLGAEPFIVPVAPTNMEEDYRAVVQDPRWVERVKQAGGVYFTGGSQARITQALYAKDGAHTPMLEAVWDVYRRGGVVSGSSAGAAIMSRIMFSHPQSVLATLHNGVKMGTEVDRGLGFLDPAWFVEQHCLARGRFARTLVAMQSQGLKYGVGIDEDSAVVVRNGCDMRVMGYKGALIFDLTDASHDATRSKFNLKNARISYLDRGDSINLKTLAVTPSPQKKNSPKIDPTAADFRPSGRKPLFYSDILTNSTICTLMCQTLEHSQGEGTGLAYDGAAARDGQAEGFEFRLYRDKDSCGWNCDDEGYDSYTVVNLRMDIEPVAINAPLYTYLKPKAGEADPMVQAASRSETETRTMTETGTGK